MLIVRTMKSFYLLAVFFVAAKCSHLRVPRDVSELFNLKHGVQTRPAPVYWQPQDNSQGYDYPRPGISTRPIYRDPEPVIPDTVSVRPRPVYPIVVQRPYPVPDQGYIPRPTYVPQNTNGYNYQNDLNRFLPSEKILWPLFNKIAGVFSGNGQFPNYHGTNSIGYPGGNNIFPQYPGNYPGNYPGKFPFLNELFPNNYNYQRIETPVPAPSVYTGSNNGFVNIQQPGLSSIGDSVVVDAVPAPAPAPQEGEGYSYPNPNELRPPLELPDGLQFRAQPKDDNNSQ